MNLKLTSLTLGAILSVCAGPLDAQESIKRWSVSGSVGLGTDNLNDITSTGTSWWNVGAYNLDFGYSGNLANTTVPFRVSIGTNYLPAGSGKITDSNLITIGRPETYGLRGYYLAGDLFIDSRISDSLQILVGGSLNSWTMTRKSDDPSETKSIPGVKFGGRFGLQFNANENLSFNVIFQFIEVGHSYAMVRDENNVMPVAGPRPWNPSWLQFGLKYSF